MNERAATPSGEEHNWRAPKGSYYWWAPVYGEHTFIAHLKMIPKWCLLKPP